LDYVTGLWFYHWIIRIRIIPSNYTDTMDMGWVNPWVELGPDFGVGVG
jgi:hypothetical protein